MTEETILIVDENESNLTTLKSAFDSADYDVETAANADDALEISMECTVAVVIIAVGKTAADTINFLQALADNSPQTECILLVAPGAKPAALEALYQFGNVFSHHSKQVRDLSGIGMDVARAMEMRNLRRQNSRLLIELRDSRDDLQNQFEFLGQCEKLAALGRVFNDLTDVLSQHMGEVERSASFMRERADEFARLSPTSAVAFSMIQSFESLSQSAAECRKLIRSAVSFRSGSSALDELIDLPEVIQEALGLLTHSLSVRGIRVRWNFESGLHPVIGCRSQLREMFNHLALNCIDAMPSGGMITISAETTLDGKAICVKIHDTGEGIPEDVIPRVFEPFFTTRAPRMGTGLGLSIVRQIVREHDGEIAIHSSEGRGTEVTLRLAVTALAVLPKPQLAMAA
jgi:signal transduction histidine kinase